MRCGTTFPTPWPRVLGKVALQPRGLKAVLGGLRVPRLPCYPHGLFTSGGPMIRSVSVLSVAALFLSLAVASPAFAGGYDTPILYSARHMGMGGTAQGYVNDPSALFHNPAGLANVKNISVLGDFSLVLGSLKSSPSTLTRLNDANPESELTVAPFFLVGGAFRVHENITLGVAVYPVASAGGLYKTSGTLTNLEDETTLVFIEAAPGVAVNLPYGINLGASYRVTYASLDRRIESDAGKVVDLSLSGLNFASFRLGAQWAAIEEETIEAADAYRRLSFGLMYRHKTSIDLTADSATVFGSPVSDAETTFILPSRLVFGTRGDWGRFGGAVDVEYGFNSQNDVSKISGTCVQTGGCTGGIDEGAKASFSSVFDWKNAITLRTGLEYRLLEAGRLKPRVGYIFDGTTSSKQYPTGFGTPPAPTHSITLGCGYDFGALEANLAYAYRFGSTTVTAADIGPRTCEFCGGAGDYSISMHGIYADVSYDFE